MGIETSYNNEQFNPGQPPSKRDNATEDTSGLILNQWDRKMLEQGADGVMKKIMERFKGELPKAIIYPETSGRPLHYLFEPIFSSIAEAKGQDKPTSIFLRIDRDELFWRRGPYDMVEALGNNPGLDYDPVRKNTLADFAAIHEEEKKYQEFDEEQKVRQIKRRLAVERVEEIIERLKKENISLDEVAVIDEFIGAGETFNTVKHLFDGRVFFVGVFGIFSEFEEHVGYMNGGTGISESNPKNYYPGELSYRGSNAVGVTKSEERPDKYVEANNKKEGFSKEDQEQIAQLRRELRHIGEELALEYEKYLEVQSLNDDPNPSVVLGK